MDSLQERIAALEERLQAQERELRELRTQLDDAGRVPFRITDSSGRVVLEVDVDETGPQLRLLNPELQTWVALGGDEDGGVVGVYNNHEQEGVVVFATPEGGRLVLFADGGKTRVALGADGQGGHVGVFDQTGKLVFSRP